MGIVVQMNQQRIQFPPRSEFKTQKEHFIAFAELEPSLPLYMQPWWLDATCTKGEWDVSLSYDNTGQIEGALVFYQVKLKSLVSAIVMPELTPHSGVWMRIHDEYKLKSHSKYTHVKRILDNLISQLPEVSIYTQKFQYTLTDWQPFYWRGYKGETHYTYQLENIEDIEGVYDDLKGSVRTDIRKAERNLVYGECEDIDLFYGLCEKSFQKQAIKPPFSKDVLKKLDQELSKRKLRKMYVAFDLEGNAHAAIYIVLGKNSAHYLAGGSDPDKRHSGAVTLLLWKAIQDASKLGKDIFDFEGSMLAPVEFAFRSFGAVQKPFFRITKAKNMFFEALTLLFKNYK